MRGPVFHPPGQAQASPRSQEAGRDAVKGTSPPPTPQAPHPPSHFLLYDLGHQSLCWAFSSIESEG